MTRLTYTNTLINIPLCCAILFTVVKHTIEWVINSYPCLVLLEIANLTFEWLSPKSASSIAIFASLVVVTNVFSSVYFKSALLVSSIAMAFFALSLLSLILSAYKPISVSVSTIARVPFLAPPKQPIMLQTIQHLIGSGVIVLACLLFKLLPSPPILPIPGS